MKRYGQSQETHTQASSQVAWESPYIDFSYSFSFDLPMVRPLYIYLDTSDSLKNQPDESFPSFPRSESIHTLPRIHSICSFL